MIALRRSLCSIVLLLAACGGAGMGTLPTGQPNLDAVPAAKAGCEAPTAASLQTGAMMLPGRVCELCHKVGGQSPIVWTASGTVFGSLTSQCNNGGLANVKVEILDSNLKTQVTLTTNSAGNFMTTQALTFPITARITGPTGKVAQMFGPRMTGACSGCHQQPPVEGAPGRITPNL